MTNSINALVKTPPEQCTITLSKLLSEHDQKTQKAEALEGGVETRAGFGSNGDEFATGHPSLVAAEFS